MPKNKPLRLIIDTNLWVSFIISNKQNLLNSLLFSENARLLFSEELIVEIKQTIVKPKLKNFLAQMLLKKCFQHSEPFIDLIEVKSIVTVCRDTKDNFLLALAKDGHADYLLTGDRDLLELKKFGNTMIKTVVTFIDETKNFR